MRYLLNARHWLLAGVVFGSVGLFLVFFGFMIVGAGVSGSGCGKKCQDRFDLLTFIGEPFLALAVFSALFSVILEWKQAVETRVARKIVIAAFNSLIMFICGSAFILVFFGTSG